MAQNTLKQKARLFAQKHGLPYATALRAVDEPLHELRDLAQKPDREYTALHPHFRLTGERSIYDPVFPEIANSDWPSHEYRKLVIEKDLSRFSSPNDFLKELGRRLTLIEDAKTKDIWEYRELYRAGLLAPDAPSIEPFFHYFGTMLPWGFDSVFIQGPYVGIFGVSIAAFMEYEGPISLTPITKRQLSAVQEGRSPGELKLPPICGGTGPRDSIIEPDPRFAKIAFSNALGSDGRNPRLMIVFREDPKVSGVNIEDLGLNWDDFYTDDTSHKTFEIIRNADMVKFSVDYLRYEGCSDRLLEL